MKRKIVGIMLTILAVASLVLAGCASPAAMTDAGKNASSPAMVSSGATGQLEIRVTDAPPKEEITSIMVTVQSIEIKRTGSGNTKPVDVSGEEGIAEEGNGFSDNWTKVEFDGDAFDLLKVKDNPQAISSGSFATGAYNVRLEVGSLVVYFGDGTSSEAKVPSGKIKFNSPFQITGDQLTVLTLDFDASRSINVTGNGKVIFKPVIKLASEHENKGPDNNKGKKQGIDITTDNLPEGSVGLAYNSDNATLEAVGGTEEYTWEITAGDLPDGLTLAENGEINGTPILDQGVSYPYDYTFTVKVTDGSNPAQTVKKELFITIKNAT